MPYEANDVTVGEAVRENRVKCEMTQTEVADRMTVIGFPMQQQTILKIEKGVRSLKLAEAIAMAEEVFGCSVSHLVPKSEAKREALRCERKGADTIGLLATAVSKLNAANVRLEEFKQAASELSPEAHDLLQPWAKNLLSRDVNEQFELEKRRKWHREPLN